MPGVDVAAPLANAGIVIPYAALPVEIPEAERASGAGQMYQVSQTWSAVRGISRYAGNRDFVYSTTDPHACGALSDKASVDPPEPQSAFDVAGPKFSTLFCYDRGQTTSGATCWQLDPNYYGTPTCLVQDYLTLAYPLAIAGIDPVQESKLLGLNRTIVSGRGLTEDDTFTTNEHGSVVPVIASSRTYADIQLQLAIGQVQVPAGRNLPALLSSAGRPTPAGSGAYRLLRSLPVAPMHTIHPQRRSALPAGAGRAQQRCGQQRLCERVLDCRPGCVRAA
ncbi:MAG: hypothetical protein ACR2LF_08645 [Jatrophihabitantaceae bacterium]